MALNDDSYKSGSLRKKQVPTVYFALVVVAGLAIAGGIAMMRFSSTPAAPKPTAEGTVESVEEVAFSPISKSALNELSFGLTRSDVIGILGPATWASLPTDRGRLAAPNEMSLELRWANPECRPVTVSFDRSGRVVGWDDGAGNCNQRIEYPMDRYRCTKEDRAQLCQ